MPDDPEYDAIIGSYMYDRGRYENAARYLEQMLEKIRKKEVFNPSLVTGDMKSLYRFLVFSYEKLENYDKFFSYAVQALQIDSKQDELIETLLRYLTERDPATTDEIYQFLHQIYDLNSQKDVIYLMRMSLRIGNEELTELLKADLTEENKNQLFQN
jgi:tetratricopeptide (TPR) repeat protein